MPIAELFISVSADVNAAVNGLNSLNGQLNRTTNSFQTAAPAALALAGAAAAVGAGLAAAVNVAADFEHQMSGVKAVMSPNEVAQFGTALDDLALTLGRDTVFSSQQAAAAIEELIKAGVPAATVLEGAGQAALALAAATGVTTAEAATIAGQALNTFGIDAKGMTAVVDRLASVANASASDISFLRFGLASVGGVAAGVGLSFDDTAVALGLLSNTFASGSDAGTSFKAFLNGLIPDSKKQIALFKQLGLLTKQGGSEFFDASGKMRNLEQIAGILHDTLQGLTDEQRQQALTTIFGTDGQRAANALFKLGADAVQQFTNQTGESGVATKSAATRLDNLQGTLTNLGGSFERVQILVGRLFLPALRSAAEFAKTLVDNFGNLSPETQRLAVFVVAGAAALLGFVAAMILLGVAIPPLTASFGALNAILLLNPIVRVVTLLFALAAAAVVLFNSNEDFRNSALGVWDVIQNQLVPAIVAAAAAIGEKLSPFFDAASQAFSNFVTSVGPLVAEFFATTLPQALSAFGTQVESLGPLFESLTSFFGAVFSVIGSIAGVGGTALRGLFENVLVPGFQQLGIVLAPVQPLIASVAAGFREFDDTFGLIGEHLKPVTEFFTNITPLIQAAAQAISTFQLPGFLTPSVGVGGVGGAPVAAGVPAGAAAAGGKTVNVNINMGDINGDSASIEAILQNFAAHIADAADRVFLPPDNTGVPQLAP